MKELPSIAQFSELVQGCTFLGEVGRNLCCSQVMLLARAFGDFASPEGDGLFAIGHDVRASSPSLTEAVSLGLRSGGHHVIHIDVCTKPLLEWYIDYADLHGGIMITGGSAAAQWNGLHLYTVGAQLVPAARILDTLVDSDLNHLFARPCEPQIRHDQPLQAYAAQLRQRFKPATQVNLCLDTGHGMSGSEIAAIMAHFPQMRLRWVSFDPASSASSPDAGVSARRDRRGSSSSVVAHGCYLGAAVSADCDVLTVFDEQGAPLKADTVGVLLALALAPKAPGCCVLYGSGVRPMLLHRLQQAHILTRPIEEGPCATYAALHQGDACFYFDGAGHYAFGDFPGTANALLALLELINHLTLSPQTLSALADDIEQMTRPVPTTAPLVGDHL